MDDTMDESAHIEIFGYQFSAIDWEHIGDLFSLEREGIIYTDHWIDELDDFRHVRIEFTQEEAREYARRLYAFELFLQAGSPKFASDVPGIATDIAADADSYELESVDGTVFPAPYHCPAAFLGPELESLVCSATERRKIIALQGREGLLLTVRSVIDALTPAIRLCVSREKGLEPWPVSREDDVRDLLYVMLRPAVSDLRREEPVPSKAGGFKLVDLSSNLSHLLIEVKWVNDRQRWKRVRDEIAADIQHYYRHPSCKDLIFVVLDACKAIQDPRLIEQELSGRQTIDGITFKVEVYVREP